MDSLDELSGDDSSPLAFAGITPTSITTTVTSSITVPLNANLDLRRLLFGAATCVDLVLLMDMKIGTVSLNVGTQGIPCVAFKHDAVGTSIRAAIEASPSVPPIVTVKNGTGGTIIVEGAVFGLASRA